MTTIHDVARRAQVGIGTVSRVMNNSAQVSPETRERVLAAIRELRFKPNRAARQLPRGTPHRTVGVLLPFFTDEPFVERLRGVQIALREWAGIVEQTGIDIGRRESGRDNGRINLILYSVDGPDQLPEQLTMIIQQGQIDGLLVLALTLDQDQIDSLHTAGIAVARVYDSPLENVTTPAVCLDNRRGGLMATEHLINLGHTRIAYIGDSFPDPYQFPTSRERYTGYCDALERHRLPLRDEYVQFGAHTQQVAQQSALQLVRLPEPPTAIFAMSDMQAVSALTALRDAGIDVPGQVSLIGFDDIEISRYIGLTTIRQHFEDSGRAAMEMLLQLLEMPPDPERTSHAYQIVPLKLIERATTSRLTS